VDRIEALLGQALLVLVGLAVVLLTIIVLLVEAHCILRLARKLARRWRSWGSGITDSVPGGRDIERPRDQQEAR
jgi:Na+-transporting methylmalonyl-CoA/oxaloacetate decarboxylase gamma subunit